MAGDRGMGDSSEAASEPPGGSAAVGSRTVFLSYASPDAEIAQQVCQALETQGVLCWMAPRDVRPGAQYADAIVRAINEAKALVLVLSASAVGSLHVGKEVEQASSKRKQVIALRIDAALLTPALEYFLSESQWIDVPGLGMPAALAKLAEALRPGLENTPQVDPGVSGVGLSHAPFNPAAGTAIVAKRVIAAAATVIVLVVGGALAIHFWPPNHETAPAAATISDKSIAVLPFADLSEKHDQEYFADGIAEEVLDRLALVPGLKIVGRTSSFQFKDKSLDRVSAAAALGVAYFLEGGVRKEADRVRVTAQLIEARTGSQIWSNRFDSQVIDVLRVQDAIAAELARALQIVVEVNTVPRASVKSPEVLDAYLRGQQSADRSTQEGCEAAIAQFQKALAIDPEFAPAAIGLLQTLKMNLPE